MNLTAFSSLLLLLWSGVALAWLLRVAKDRARRVSTLVMVGFALAFGSFAFSKNGADPPRGVPPAASIAVAPAVAPVEVRTEGVTLRTESASAVEVGDWRKHGSSSGGVWIETNVPFFRIGTNPVSRAYVAASGTVSFDSTRRPPVGAPLPDGSGRPALASLLAPLGMVPEANWTNAAATSRFWHDAAPGRGRVLTSENALLDRLPGRRVSV